MAVSEFLRPLCLYRRIANFKQSLKKAIASNQPLVTEDNQNWSSSALAFAANRELRARAPCQNCRKIFQSLAGFIPTLEQGGRDTFLGACAEYCPVDQLLADEALSDEENRWINEKLQRNKKQCSELYRNFRDIETRCNEAEKRKNQRGLRNMTSELEDLSRKIRDKVHIFGVKPARNMHFGGRN